MKFLSIDPSVNNTGWATFDTTPLEVPGIERSLGETHSRNKVIAKCWRWGTWYPDGGSLEMRILDLCSCINEDIGEFDHLIIEKPAFFSSEKGMIAARQNYTIDLAAITYYIGGWFRLMHRQFHPVTAIQWKGNVSKDITKRKFFRKFSNVNTKTTTEHSIDATMLLHWWLESYAMVSPLITRSIGPELLAKML